MHFESLLLKLTLTSKSPTAFASSSSSSSLQFWSNVAAIFWTAIYHRIVIVIIPSIGWPLTLTLPPSLSHSLSLSLSLSLSHTHTQTHTLSLYPSLTQSHSLSHSLSLSLTPSLTLYLSLCVSCLLLDEQCIIIFDISDNGVRQRRHQNSRLSPQCSNRIFKDDRMRFSLNGKYIFALQSKWNEYLYPWLAGNAELRSLFDKKLWVLPII